MKSWKKLHRTTRNMLSGLAELVYNPVDDFESSMEIALNSVPEQDKQTFWTRALKLRSLNLYFHDVRDAYNANMAYVKKSIKKIIK